MRNKIKTLGTISAIALALVIFSSASAVENSPTRTRMPDKSEEKSTERSSEMTKERMMTQRPVKSFEARKNAVKKLMTVQIDRASKALERLSNLLARIENRKAKMAAEGMNMATVEPLIVKAEAEMAEVAKNIGEARDILQSMENSDDPKTLAQTFMTKMREAKTNLQEFHTALKAVVKEMVKIERAFNDVTKEEGDENE